jgi:hypothetical protein
MWVMRPFGVGVAVGMALGVAVGDALGRTVGVALAVGLVLGLGVGVCAGLGVGAGVGPPGGPGLEPPPPQAAKANAATKDAMASGRIVRRVGGMVLPRVLRFGGPCLASEAGGP